jgi:Lipid A 3-O-deacylase (PagL)
LLFKYEEDSLLNKALRKFRTIVFLIPIAVLLREPVAVQAEDAGPGADKEDAEVRNVPSKTPPERELIVEGLASYGNYRIFAAGRDCKLYSAGLEYDRHSWGYFLRAQMDYVAEYLPLVLLREPTVTYPWGQPVTAARRIVPGMGFSPIGFRMLWRSNTSFKPYLLAKGGMIVFDKKVPASAASYQNFSLQSAMGVQTRLTPRVDLRLGLFSDFHFSNAFMVPDNPGLDVMNANLALSYHLGKRPE